MLTSFTKGHLYMFFFDQRDKQDFKGQFEKFRDGTLGIGTIKYFVPQVSSYKGSKKWAKDRYLESTIFHKILTVEFDFAAISVTVCGGGESKFLSIYFNTHCFVHLSPTSSSVIELRKIHGIFSRFSSKTDFTSEFVPIVFFKRKIKIY
jgi:hypothetical protein